MAVSSSVRFEVLRRDGFACCYCGRHPPSVALHVDHVVPRSRGGSDRPENLVAACQDCNLGKSDRLLDGPVLVAANLLTLDLSVPRLCIECDARFVLTAGMCAECLAYDIGGS